MDDFLSELGSAKFTEAISCCEKGYQWSQVLEILKQMKQAKIQVKRCKGGVKMVPENGEGYT